MTEIERLITEGFITEDFLKEEERCGYLVPMSMKKAWAIQLDLLVKLINVCKKHNLHLWVGGGSLLGAVRHKGFIPWDDDSDVFMPRDDYDKLLTLYDKEFESPYFLDSQLNEKELWGPYARIRNSNTFACDTTIKRRDQNWNHGIFVDIFPLDGVSSNKILSYIHYKLLRFEDRLLFAYALNRSKRIQGRIMYNFLHLPFIPYNSIKATCHLHKLSKLFNYHKASKVGLLLCSPYEMERNIFDKKDWEETIWLPFENIMVPVPKGYDNILKVAFGNYMEFPPIEKRGTWHFIEFDAETPYEIVMKRRNGFKNK